MPDPNRNLDWIPAYTAIAGQLSNTFGSSTGTQVTIPTNGCNGLIIMASAISLTAATELRITPVDWDGTVEVVPVKTDGTSPIYKVLFAANRSLKGYPVSSPFIRIEPWLDQVDAAATCTIKVKYIS